MEKEQYHPSGAQVFAEVVLPIAVPKTYTYSVPERLVSQLKFGQRVEVQFGRSKLYTALVININDSAPADYHARDLISILDEHPIIHPLQLRLWKWMASYYSCTLGEVMNAALPSHFKLTSETILLLSPFFTDDFTILSDKEYLITEALTIQNEISIDDVRKILEQKTVYPLIKSLLDKKVILLKEDLKQKYKPKKVTGIRLQEPYLSHSGLLAEAFEKVGKSTRQTEALLGWVQLSKKKNFISRPELCKLANIDSGVINAIVKKGIFELYEKKISRLGGYEDDLIEAPGLSAHQEQALSEIRKYFEEGKVCLLHGVTGSGKTRVYVELMKETLAQGGQILYLLPEIALTAQIVNRLQKVFGDQIALYHSRMGNNERVELWNSLSTGKTIVLGARSALFLPFSNLQLIIVDEEHDRSFKQMEPNPRYNGRDSAVFLSSLCDAKVVLGTATPSLESWVNAKTGKYGYIDLPERFGGLELPEVIIADAKKELKERKLQSHFTTQLLDELKAAIERGEQAILFQNRRGFAPSYRCNTCGWHSECIHCDVSLTYHKFHNLLKCHYCGYSTRLPETCPACGAKNLTLLGFGTEKIEDELKIYLPEAKIGRLDLDSVRKKDAHAKIINDFEERRMDILVGTQMVTKGLDFENVGVVGILSADQLLQFPDFRAGERAFQLMVQVSGRAGRKHRRGKVIIQAFNTAAPVIREVIHNDYESFFAREISERKTFKYPPFHRIIKITLKHKKPQVLNDGAKIYASFLKEKLGDWVVGPAIPYISRVRSFYLLDFMIKMDPDARKMRFAKDNIKAATHFMQKQKGYSGVRVNVDVDPY